MKVAGLYLHRARLTNVHQMALQRLALQRPVATRNPFFTERTMSSPGHICRRQHDFWDITRPWTCMKMQHIRRSLKWPIQPMEGIYDIFAADLEQDNYIETTGWRLLQCPLVGMVPNEHDDTSKRPDLGPEALWKAKGKSFTKQATSVRKRQSQGDLGYCQMPAIWN